MEAILQIFKNHKSFPKSETKMYLQIGRKKKSDTILYIAELVDIIKILRLTQFSSSYIFREKD